jgi:transcriptional regulator with XRE-family HTH domain
MHQPETFTVDGDAIRQARMQAGLKRTELARRVGVTRRYICHLENGTRTQPSPPVYIALRQALQATDESLLAPPRPHPPERT